MKILVVHSPSHQIRVVRSTGRESVTPGAGVVILSTVHQIISFLFLYHWDINGEWGAHLMCFKNLYGTLLVSMRLAPDRLRAIILPH